MIKKKNNNNFKLIINILNNIILTSTFSKCNRQGVIFLISSKKYSIFFLNCAILFIGQSKQHLFTYLIPINFATDSIKYSLAHPLIP